MPTDKTTTINDLKKILSAFRKARDWEKFHTPKNVSQALSIEASELLELFLWKTDAQIARKIKDKEFRTKVEDELADIICYCINFALSADIDIARAVTSKIVKNAQKYPVSGPALGKL